MTQYMDYKDVEPDIQSVRSRTSGELHASFADDYDPWNPDRERRTQASRTWWRDVVSRWIDSFD
jgi:hypothetical protein